MSTYRNSLRRLLAKKAAAAAAEDEDDEGAEDVYDDDLDEPMAAGKPFVLPAFKLLLFHREGRYDAMDDEDAEGDEEPLPIPKAAAKKGAASEPKTKEKLFKGVTEDTPLWDEDDALEEAEEAASAKAKPAAKKAAKKPAAKAADSGVVPKVKKAVAKAAKDSVAAAKAVAGKLKKKTDITAEKIVTDKPLEFGRVVDEEEEEEAAARLPGEEIWEREALISTKSCKVFVLDISEMAHVLGYPTCDTERFVTDPEFGTLLPNASYLVPKTNLTPPMEQYTNMYPFHVLPHYESLNSAPWYVYNTLMKSERRTDDPQKADVIFVYDYCRLMWALSEEHGAHHWWASNYMKKKLTGTGGPALVSAYNVMTQMLQWKKSKGRQYVFFQSHPGFAFGNENVTKEFYDQIMCKEVGDALHLVVERGQRWKCPTYKEGNIIVTPYAGSQELFHMVRGVDADKTPLPSQRNTLVFFRGHCGPWENVAKRMRHAMVAALRQQNTSDVDACCLGEPKSQALKCTKEEAHGGGTAVDWHKALLRSMMQSRFCMIVPGDSQSSERLTDAFVSGCIPVFVGPPFHAMPFARHVDYAASSVFINLTDTRKWFGKEKAQWYLNPRTQNKHKGKEGDWWHPKWWKADTKHEETVMLKNMEQVVFYLKQMSPEEVDEKYANVMHQRHMFVYTTEPADPPSASDIVIDSICEYALEGYGMASDKYVDPEVSVEKDRRRRVSKAKAAAAEKDDRRKR
ncbi:g1967 [Coccomyxa viridis]|uniref:G1967 protein n=1 Tax=Coccomyxa viridis TaxID=1274662 RepID=A0ABP1FJ96_9CHLO